MYSLFPRLSSLIVAALLAPAIVLAQAPAGATAKCKDGTYSTAKSTQGRCSAHGGVASLVTATRKSSSTRKPTTSSPSSSSRASTTSRPTRKTTPAGATARCSDGSYSTAKTERGACSAHGGVAQWLAGAPSPTPPPATRAAPAPSVSPASGSAPSSQIPTVRAPAGAPAGATALCKDGTYSTSKVHTGACSHHGGVSQWLQ
jgi:uncharacterized protein DUF3761